MVGSLDANFNARLALRKKRSASLHGDDLLLGPLPDHADRWEFDGHFWTYDAIQFAGAAGQVV